MALTAGHTYQVLTKRADRMEAYLNDSETEHRVRLQADIIDPTGKIGPWPLRNVWVGVSVEDQERADEQIPRLLAARAHVRFVSAEPLWKPVKLELSAEPAALRPVVGGQGIHWLIAGGESGSRARPMHPGWAGSLRDECADLGIRFFYKQAGHWSPIQPEKEQQSIGLMLDGREVPAGTPGSTTLWAVGKKVAGKLLDGRIYQQWPAGYVAPTTKPHAKRSVRDRGAPGGAQSVQP
jgi:protein gp37